MYSFGQILPQVVWFKKSQPESFLQPVSIIPGKVGASHQVNLRKHHDRLHEQTARTLETEVPQYPRERAVGFSHRGLVIQNAWCHNEKPNTGWGLLQCLWEGHSCGEHFLWRFNCLWWENVISIAILYIICTWVHFPFFRIWEVSKDDLAGLHLKFGWDLWPLPRSQLHISHRITLLVHSQALWEGFGEIDLILNVCNPNFAWPDIRFVTVFWNLVLSGFFLDYSQKRFARST